MCQLKGTVQGFLLWDINDLKSLEKKKQKFDKLITSLYLLLASFQCVSVFFLFIIFANILKPRSVKKMTDLNQTGHRGLKLLQFRYY